MIVDRGLDQEAGEPKYARIEWERRWLVDIARRPDLSGRYMTLIEDRYIAGTRLRLRRMSRPDLGETKWKLTKKYDAADAAARPIVTTYLTASEHALFAMLPAHPLIKRRYHLPVGDRWWSHDVFEGALAGLELVECEAADAAGLAALTPPGWATAEITRHLPWQGGALAAHGIPEVACPIS